jgi:hypothetical protein
MLVIIYYESRSVMHYIDSKQLRQQKDSAVTQ